MRSLPRVATLVAAFITLAAAALAQSVNGIIVDQTGLPLPGVIVQVLNGDRIAATLTTNPDGTDRKSVV